MLLFSFSTPSLSSLCNNTTEVSFRLSVYYLVCEGLLNPGMKRSVKVGPARVMQSHFCSNGFRGHRFNGILHLMCKSREKKEEMPDEKLTSGQQKVSISLTKGSNQERKLSSWLQSALWHRWRKTNISFSLPPGEAVASSVITMATGDGPIQRKIGGI